MLIDDVVKLRLRGLQSIANSTYGKVRLAAASSRLDMSIPALRIPQHSFIVAGKPSLCSVQRAGVIRHLELSPFQVRRPVILVIRAAITSQKPVRVTKNSTTLH